MNKIKEMALDEAVETMFSNLGNLTAGEILSKLEEGELPEEISVWYPFEDYDPKTLAKLVEGFASQFERFAERVKEIEEAEE